MKTELKVGTDVSVFDEQQGDMVLIGQGKVVGGEWPNYSVRLTTGEVIVRHTLELIPHK